MSCKIVIFGLLAFIAAALAEPNCCETQEAKGDFWSFKRQGQDCALNINLFDGLKLITALDYIGCNSFNTLIINGQHMTKPFVASDEDMAAIPEQTNVVYENIQSVHIEKDETGTNLKSLNLVGSEDFKFHPSLLDEADFIEFDGVKLSYNSDERVFQMTQTDPKVFAPRAESLIANGQGSSANNYQPSDFEILLMTICGIQLLVISMIVVIVCSSKAAKRRESMLPRNQTSSSLTSSNFSTYASSQYSSTNSEIHEAQKLTATSQPEEIHECSVMIEGETKN